MRPSAPDAWSHLVVFTLDGRSFAFALAAVERVLPMVDVTPFPRAPDIVAGVIDLQGELVPVLDVRRRFRLPPRPVSIHDQLVVARTSRRRVAVAVEGVTDVIVPGPDDVIEPEAIVPGLEHVRGVARLAGGGLIVIHDLDTFLSLDEEERLTAALTA